MEGWQCRSREERDFLNRKFREARALVERLAQENQSLLGRLNHSSNQSPGNSLSAGSQDKNLEGYSAKSNGLTNSAEVCLQEQSQKKLLFSYSNGYSKHDFCIIQLLRETYKQLSLQWWYG